jgi:hypothetical protein
MFSKYVEHKLKNKLKSHLSLAGFDTNIDISSLVDKIKELGSYKITWRENLPVDINRFNYPHRVKVESGKYHIISENSHYNFNRQCLYSSEFIEFNLKEMREYKLNKILN